MITTRALNDYSSVSRLGEYCGVGQQTMKGQINVYDRVACEECVSHVYI